MRGWCALLLVVAVASAGCSILIGVSGDPVVVDDAGQDAGDQDAGDGAVE